MNAFINPPTKIPFYIKIGLYISKKVTKKDLLVPKLLAWYPKVAISSGILESLVAHGGKDLNNRILKLIRIQASLTVSCPFCIDMNSFKYEEDGISKQEILALAGKFNLSDIKTFSKQELLALEYTRHLSQTPIKLSKQLVDEVKVNFNERELVILSSTIAQVNYWARLIQGLGVPPEGFSTCSIL